MSMYPRLLGIAAVVFGFGLSEAPPPAMSGEAAKYDGDLYG
jgi:hypothetical protein